MSKTIKIEIEIPAPPEGWGHVEYRKVLHEEDTVMFWDGQEWQKCHVQTGYAYPVARKLTPLWTPPPQWHTLFGDCWLTRDKHGNVRLHQTKPELFCEHGIWEASGSEFYLLPFRTEMLPPRTIPWDKCCFKIGEPKE